MASGEEGAAASFHPTEVQAGVPRYGEEGGAEADERELAGDERDSCVIGKFACTMFCVSLR